MEKMYTMKQAAEELGCTKSRIHQLIIDLELSPKKVDGAFGRHGFCYLLSIDDLNQLKKN